MSRTLLSLAGFQVIISGRFWVIAEDCGLCGDEKSSADKVMRTPLSKQRNKHIQRVLVEAAKLAPRHDHNLALVYEREKQKGNANRGTLAVARKMVAYLLAVDRGQRDFVPFPDSQSAAA